MANLKWDILGYAFLAAASLAGIGVAIGERSLIIALVSILVLAFSMGSGFRKKRSRKAAKRS